jgi:hypothetical protein
VTATTSVTFSAASTVASTTNITAGTITTATNVTTVNGLAAGVITAASIATGAIDADSLAADAGTEIASAVWDMDATAHQTGGTFGQAIGDPGADTNTIFKATVTDATGATVGVDVVDLKTQIGTAGAGLSNIGTIATVTNLTNERSKYALGAVWIGPTANTNTVSYVDGIITNPVSTIAAAKTVADALKLRRFHTVRTGASQIAATMTGYDFAGVAWSLTSTGSQDVGTSAFTGAELTGGTFAATTGTIIWHDCDFPVAVSVGKSHMTLCTFGSTLTLSETGDYDFIDCASVVAGAAAPVFAVPAGVVNISFRRWSGGIRLTGLTADTTVSIDVVSGGTVTLEGTAATVVIRGMVTGVTNSMSPSAGSVTQTAVVNQGSIADAVWDEDATAHQTQGTFGQAIGDPAADTNTLYSDVGAIKAKERTARDRVGSVDGE